MSELDMYIYMSSGDLLDIVEFAVPSARPYIAEVRKTGITDHCSGLVSMTENEIYLG